MDEISRGKPSLGPSHRDVPIEVVLERDISRIEEKRSYTCDEAIEHVGFGWFQIKLLFLAGLCWSADAMEMMLLSFLSPIVACEWNLSSVETALITSVVFIGMFIGSYAWGIFSDKFGRRVGYFATAAFTGAFGLLSAFANTYWSLLLTRAFVGIGLGGAPVSFSLFAEYLPKSKRGVYLLLIELFWTIGTVVEAALAWLLLPTLGWRWLLGISALPSLLLVLLFPIVPESARYHLIAGRTEKASECLLQMAHRNDSSLPDGELLSTQSATRGSVKDLFQRGYRKTTLLLWLIWFGNAFSYYGLVLLTTEVLKLENCEDENVNCSQVFSNSDYVDIFVTTFAELPGLLLSTLMVNRLGRKRTQALEFLLVGASCFVLFIDFPRILQTLFFFLARAFIFGTFGAVYVYTPEAYPTSMRTTALGASSSFGRIGGIVSPYVAQTLLVHCMPSSRRYPLGVYGVVCLVSGIAALFLPVETTGLGMADVVEEGSVDSLETHGLIQNSERVAKDRFVHENIQA